MFNCKIWGFKEFENLPTEKPEKTPWSRPRLRPLDLMPDSANTSCISCASAGSPTLGYLASYMNEGNP